MPNIAEQLYTGRNWINRFTASGCLLWKLINTKDAGKKFQQTTFWNISLIFFLENRLDISCKLSPLWRQFAWNVKVYFVGKIMNLASAESAKRAVKVKEKLPPSTEKQEIHNNAWCMDIQKIIIFIIIHKQVFIQKRMSARPIQLVPATWVLF